MVQPPQLPGCDRNLHGEKMSFFCLYVSILFFHTYFTASIMPTCWITFLFFSFSVQPVKKKHRARMIEYFIDVARECFNIGNFNSLMAIICECFLEDTCPLYLLWNVFTEHFQILVLWMKTTSWSWIASKCSECFTWPNLVPGYIILVKYTRIHEIHLVNLSSSEYLPVKACKWDICIS